MKKKLFKYLKCIISMIMIIALTVPSYATLSASDGSAFVTKAEFDSALADFNSRLTTFEAGINSKIDSQVTTYLDRNGIWSGKEQTILLFNTATTTGYWSSSNSLFAKMINSDDFKNESSKKSFYLWENQKGKLFTSNKSGLANIVRVLEANNKSSTSSGLGFTMVMPFKGRSSTSGWQGGFPRCDMGLAIKHQSAGSTTWQDDISMPLCTGDWCLIPNTGTNTDRLNQTGESIPNWNSSQYINCAFAPQLGVTTFYFFVSKNTDYYLYETAMQTFSFSDTYWWHNWHQSTSPYIFTAGSWQETKMQLKCTVY